MQNSHNDNIARSEQNTKNCQKISESGPESLPLELIGDDDSFINPVSIDSDLARLLTVKGQQARFAKNLVFIIGLLFGMSVSFFSSMFGIPFVGLSLFLLGTVVGLIAVTQLKTSSLVSAYRARRFDKVTQLMPSALAWATQLNPFTFFQFLQCMQVQHNVLMLEGRYSEFEAVYRFYWGLLERRKEIGTSPTNWAIASNLAVALFLQHHYEAAAKSFSENLPKAKSKSDRLTLLCNLAYCMIKTKNFDEADRYLYEALELTGKKMESAIGMRLQFVSAYLQTEKGEFDSAELSIQQASELSLRLKQPDDFRAYCNAAMADVRRRQKRFDEADLYFRNAVDVLAAADNPGYFDLAVIYRDYAKTLHEAGKLEESAKQMMQAHSCYDLYVKRETETLGLIRLRLESKKPIRVATQLLNLGSRVKSIEVLDI